MRPEEEQIEICAACGVAGGKLKGVRNLFGKRVYLHVGLCIDHVKSALEAAQKEAAELREAVNGYLAIHNEPPISLKDAIEEARSNESWVKRSHTALEKMEEAIARTEKEGER